MSIRLRVIIATILLVMVSVAGVGFIVRNMRAIVGNQKLIVFKDKIFHEHEVARERIQSAQARLYQHQAGYTRDIDRLVTDIESFEEIITGITPHYRQHFSRQACNPCHEDGIERIEFLEETLRGVLRDLDRYRESVSIILTTNDRQARILHNGIANSRGEQILKTISDVNLSAASMVGELRDRGQSLLKRSEAGIEAALAILGAAFLLSTLYLLWNLNSVISSLLKGTESVARDDFTHRLPMASRRDEVGLLASRFNLMAEHLQARDEQVTLKTGQVEDANRQLRELNETLETKVRDRTSDLEESLGHVKRTTTALGESKRRLEAANQELVRANQTKANFLSIISHELKTPLSVINGFLSLILDERYQNDPQHLREAVQISKRRGEQLSRMIDELIDLSRLDARSMILRRQEIAPEALVRRVAEEFREECERRDLRLDLAISDGLPTVSCDPDKFRQVISNIISNAVKFSLDGGRIEFGVEERGDEILFSCRDTGIGIPLEEHDKIFEKFYQVDSTATRRFGGAGLGLSIVKEIVLLHGGRLWVESAPGQGSAFFISLPKQAPYGEAALEG